MLAVGLARDAVLADLDRLGNGVEVAAVNGPNAVTVAGEIGPLQAAASQWESAGHFVRMLDVEVPYHSRAMDPILDELGRALSGLTLTTPTIPVLSTATGRWWEEPWDAAYWQHNVRRPVQFADAAAAAVRAGYATFLEVGPHHVLAANLRYHERHRASIVEDNVAGTREAVRLAASLGCRRFVYVSTAYTCGRRTGRTDCFDSSHPLRGTLHID